MSYISCINLLYARFRNILYSMCIRTYKQAFIVGFRPADNIAFAMNIVGILERGVLRFLRLIQF
jgi:hypothetical protein